MLNQPITRRRFVGRGLALLAATPSIPSFLALTADQLAVAAAEPGAAKNSDLPVLVVLQLAGGNDALSMIIPYGDDAYHRARPTLGRAARDVLKLDDTIGLNPNLTGLKNLLEQKHLAIVQGVGYPNPSRSHFRSMDVWQSAQPQTEHPLSGWLGRYFDQTCGGEPDPHVGLAIGQSLPLAMSGGRVTPLALENPDRYRYRGPDPQRFEALNQLPRNSDEANANQSALQFITRTAIDAQRSSRRIRDLAGGISSRNGYPATQLGQQLRTVAAMICGNLGSRVYYVTLGGFDTHVQQQGRHDALMRQLGESIEAFWKDLSSAREAERVMMMTFSEFGRRVSQNASGGTDHGAAAGLFLIGPKLPAAIFNPHPSLTDLDQGDLRWQVDFRSVYATLLEKWLKTPSAPILGGRWPMVNL